MRIKKGDLVKVIAGDDRGKVGKVIRVFLKKGRLEVEGVNLHKRHLKSQGQNQPGGIVEVSLPIQISNVMVVCPKCKQGTRVKFTVSGDDKHRLCRKCGEMIS